MRSVACPSSTSPRRMSSNSLRLSATGRSRHGLGSRRSGSCGRYGGRGGGFWMHLSCPAGRMAAAGTHTSRWNVPTAPHRPPLDLVAGLVAHVGVSVVDELHCKGVELVEVVRGVGDLWVGGCVRGWVGREGGKTAKQRQGRLRAGCCTRGASRGPAATHSHAQPRTAWRGAPCRAPTPASSQSPQCGRCTPVLEGGIEEVKGGRDSGGGEGCQDGGPQLRAPYAASAGRRGRPP